VNYKIYVGTYLLTTGSSPPFVVWESNNTLLAGFLSQGVIEAGTTMNLTAYEYAENVFRVQYVDIDGIDCRQLSDGPEGELIYFNVKSNQQVTALILMGSLYEPQSLIDNNFKYGKSKSSYYIDEL